MASITRAQSKKLGAVLNELRPLTRTLCDKPVKSDDKEYIPPGGHYRPMMTVLKEGTKPRLKGVKSSTPPRNTDILIIGGGLVGTAVAYFMKSCAERMVDVTIVERDYAYTRASSMLSVGGLRHQFSLPENVQMSMYTTEFLKYYKEHLSVIDQDPPIVDFHHGGYLFLAPEDRADYLAECVLMQQELGAKTIFLTKSQLAAKYPWMNLDGVDCASLGTYGEGWFDPWQLVHSLKAKNMNLGVRYCEGEVVDIRRHDFIGVDGEMHSKIIGCDIDHSDGKRYGCDFGIVVNCAGPWAGEIAKMAGIGRADDGGISIPLPVEPRKRFVYTVHCPDGPTLDCPFVIDTTGAYVRREGLSGHYICGSSPTEEEEPDISDLTVDYDYYMEQVWPTIANRVPAFNKCKLKNAWAGYYDYNTVDQNLIIGPHPLHRNFYFANGMSGHGVQQALAIGRAVFELIVFSEFRTIDLSRFTFHRFLNGKPLAEQAIV